MAQSGYTPILIYASGTTTNVPLAANLTSSASGAELALNYVDGKLFYKDSAGVVQTLATKSSTSGVFTSVTDSGLTSGRVTYATTGGLLTDSAGLTFDGTMLSSAVARFGTYASFGTESLQVAKANGTGSVGSAYQFAINSKTVNNRAEMIMTDGISANAFISYSPSATTANDKLTFNLQGSDIITVVGNSRVGIGTSSPTSTLSVTGTLSTTGETLIGGAQTLAYGLGVKYASATSTTTGDNKIIRLGANASGADVTLSFTDATSYNSNISAKANHLLLQPVAGTVVGDYSSTGLAVTGAISATGAVSSSVGFSSYLANGTNYVRLGTANYAFKFETPADNAQLILRRDDGSTGTIASFALGGVSITGTLSATGTITPSIDIQFGAGGTSFYNNQILRHTNNVLYIQGGTSGLQLNRDSSRLDTIDIGSTANQIDVITNGVTRTRTTNSGLAVTGTFSATGLTLDSSGNLGVGVTPTTGARVPSLQVGGGGTFRSESYTSTNNQIKIIGNGYEATDTSYKYLKSDSASMYNQAAGTHAWFNAASGTAGNVITFTQAMTLDTSGNLLVGVAANNAGARARLYFSTASGSNGLLVEDSSNSSGTTFAFFIETGAGQIGSITRVASTSAVAFNTTSDNRLKNDLGIATETNVIDSTVIHDFSWKTDGTVDRGVFAQEAVFVKPIAVNVGSDELNENGFPVKPWGVDYSKYVPDLIVYCQQFKKQVQEQQAIIESLLSRVAQLESK